MSEIIYSQVILLILDGWGYRRNTIYNAIKEAHPFNFNNLWKTYPHLLLPASGEAVGLPKGIIGTSEIGHTVIGAGSVPETEMLRISKAIADHNLVQNKAIETLFTYVKRHKSTLHLIGLLSDGGVHSYDEHIFAVLKAAKKSGITKIAVHVITDGRDVPPQSADRYIAKLENILLTLGVGRISTITGRFYAMDRDNRWERIQKAEDALFDGRGTIYKRDKAINVIRQLHNAGINDEFITPCILLNGENNPTIIGKFDGVFFLNFRPDRARELSARIAKRKARLHLCFATMTEYDPVIHSLVAFPPIHVAVTLSDVVSQSGLSQEHIAETEKYAHVTYFLNGGREEPHKNEKFVLVDSRRDIPTYDLAPHMEAAKIADRAIASIESGTNLTVVNFANADMVGHTGKWQPTIDAVHFEDKQIGRIIDSILSHKGIAVITADHGNAELMYDSKNQQPYTAHTLNPVPFILTGHMNLKKTGSLADIAPTILTLLGLSIPKGMTGKPLILH